VSILDRWRRPGVVACVVASLTISACGSTGGDDRGGTAASSTTPTSSAAGRPQPVSLPDGSWRPAPGLRWEVRYQGEVDPSLDVDVWDVDLDDTSEADIDRLHDAGRKVVCYFSAGSYEDWRGDADRFPKRVVGAAYAGWPGEWWIDLRDPAVRPIMEARLDRARTKGCDGVDPDNVNGFENPTGFALTQRDQLRYDRWVFDQAHRRGLATSLKNDLPQVDALVDWVDFQVNEECIANDECAPLRRFIRDGKPVVGLEYEGDAEPVCAEARRLGFDTLLKHRDLDAWRVAC